MTKFFTYSTLLTGLALLGAAQQADAQQFSKRKQYTSIGVNLNAMNYFGDVNPQTNFASFKFGNTRPNLGVTVTHRFFPRVSGRVGLAAGRITAKDDDQDKSGDAYFRNNRNLNFRNNIYELSAVAIVDLIENRNNYLKRPDFVPYVFAGVAGFYHNPQGTRDGGSTWVDFHGQQIEQDYKFSNIAFAIPFGGGVRYRINRNLDASFEIGMRKTFTGFLDGVNGNFRGPGDLGITDLGKSSADAAKDVSGVSAAQYFGYYITKDHRGGTFDAAGFKRGENKTDWYTTVGFSLNYILNPKIKNPKFR